MALTRKHTNVVRDELDRAILDAMGEDRPRVLAPGERLPSKEQPNPDLPTAVAPVLSSATTSFLVVAPKKD